jgi:hypothetical protein
MMMMTKLRLPNAVQAQICAIATAVAAVPGVMPSRLGAYTRCRRIQHKDASNDCVQQALNLPPLKQDPNAKITAQQLIVIAAGMQWLSSTIPQHPAAAGCYHSSQQLVKLEAACHGCSVAQLHVNHTTLQPQDQLVTKSRALRVLACAC